MLASKEHKAQALSKKKQQLQAAQFAKKKKKKRLRKYTGQYYMYS